MNTSLFHALLVGTGGFFGSVLRFAAGGLVRRLLPAALFPLGTLTVNLAGCLAIGFLAGIADERALMGGQARLFIILGFLGGFTTFSAFGHETLALLRSSAGHAMANVLLHVAGGLAAVWGGQALSRLV